MFIHLFLCDSVIFTNFFDRNAWNIKIHVILFVKMSGYVLKYKLITIRSTHVIISISM